MFTVCLRFLSTRFLIATISYYHAGVVQKQSLDFDIPEMFSEGLGRFRGTFLDYVLVRCGDILGRFFGGIWG